MNDKLKLEILWSMVEKITKPLKAITGGNKEAAKALKGTRDQLAELNQAQSRIDGWRKLDKDLSIVNNSMAGAQSRIKALKAEIAATETPTKAMNKALKQAQLEANLLKNRHGELIDKQQRLRIELAGAGMNTKNLATHQVELRGKIDTATAAVARQSEELKKQNVITKQMIALRAQRDKAMQMADRVGAAGRKVLMTGAVATAATLVPVVAYAQAEDAATQLRIAMMEKGGQVSADFDKINQLAMNLGNRLPGTTSDFQDMMTMLMRQGMPAKALLGGLGESTAYLAVQMRMAPTAAAEFASKLQDATRSTDAEMMGLMDTIQRTFNLGVDSDNMLAAFAKLAPSLSVLRMEGLAASNVLAPLLVMADQAGMQGEAAGNAYRKVFQNIMDAKKMADGNSMLAGTGINLNFTDGKGEFGGMDKLFSQLAQLRNVNTEKRLGALKKIFGDDAETLQAVSIMIEKGATGYAIVQGKMERQAGIQDRVNAQLGTLKSLWEAATGTFTNLLVAFGETLAPELKALTEWIGNTTAALQGWAAENPALAGALMKTLAVIAVLLTAVGGLMIAVSAVAVPFIMFKFALASMGIAFPSVAAGLGLIKSALFLVGKAAWALVANPIGLTLLALAAAAYLIYDNWAPISTWFIAMFERIKAALGGFMDAVKNGDWKSIGGYIIAGLEMGLDFMTAGLYSKVKKIATGLATTVKEALGIHSPSRVFAELGGYTMEGLQQGIDQGRSGPLGAVTSAAKAITAAGAGLFLGGPAFADSKPLLDTRPPMAHIAPASGSPSMGPITINIYPAAGTDAAEIGREVQRQLQAAQAQQAARHRSRLTDSE